MDELNLDEEKKITRSPSCHKMIIKHDIDLEDKKYNNTWNSCCLTMDRRAVQFFTQIFVISGVMIFSVIQLYRLDTCEGQQAYLGLLTLLIGILVPNPKFQELR